MSDSDNAVQSRPKYELHTMLTLSTAHLTPHESKIIDAPDSPFVVSADNYGWVVTIDESFGEGWDDFYVDLTSRSAAYGRLAQLIHDLAGEIPNLDHVRFDQDGDTVDGLEAFTW